MTRGRRLLVATGRRPRVDGIVNTLDFVTLSNNFGSTNAVWGQGDFNYDGVVNSFNFNALATNFGAAPIPGGTVDAPVLGSLVPEPASLTMLAMGAATLLGRRRRSR